MEILFSSESFDEQCQNLKMFILYTKLSKHLEQLGFKKYGDNMEIKYFVSMNTFMQHLPILKKKFQMTKTFQGCVITSIVHTPSPETVSTSSDGTYNKLP